MDSTTKDVGGPSVCEEREKELQQITDYILQMYQQYDLSTDEYQKKLPCLEAKYKVNYKEFLRNCRHYFFLIVAEFKLSTENLFNLFFDGETFLIFYFSEKPF